MVHPGVPKENLKRSGRILQIAPRGN